MKTTMKRLITIAGITALVTLGIGGLVRHEILKDKSRLAHITKTMNSKYGFKNSNQWVFTKQFCKDLEAEFLRYKGRN